MYDKYKKTGFTRYTKFMKDITGTYAYPEFMFHYCKCEEMPYFNSSNAYFYLFSWIMVS